MLSITHSNPIRIFTLAVICALLLGACRGETTTQVTGPIETGQPAGETQPAGATPTPAPSDTPSPTPVPLALRVNERGISVGEYEAELRMVQEAEQGSSADASAAGAQSQRVIDALVEAELLAQGAWEAGYTLDDATLEAEIARLAADAGGEQALRDWKARYGYSDDSFRAALRRQMAAAWQRDQVGETVPVDAEQVHARQILTTDEPSAQRALSLVKVPGVNFATYAFRYDPLVGGDLGWFPRGYLTQPEIEEVAFSLQPGEFSEVIQSAIGYHVVQVIAREVRPLSLDARRTLQRAAVRAWIDQRRSAATIEVLLPLE